MSTSARAAKSDRALNAVPHPTKQGARVNFPSTTSGNVSCRLCAADFRLVAQRHVPSPVFVNHCEYCERRFLGATLGATQKPLARMRLVAECPRKTGQKSFGYSAGAMTVAILRYICALLAQWSEASFCCCVLFSRFRAPDYYWSVGLVYPQSYRFIRPSPQSPRPESGVVQHVSHLLVVAWRCPRMTCAPSSSNS